MSNSGMFICLTLVLTLLLYTCRGNIDVNCTVNDESASAASTQDPLLAEYIPTKFKSDLMSTGVAHALAAPSSLINTCFAKGADRRDTGEGVLVVPRSSQNHRGD
jgi:hypothetical protein